MAQMLAALTSKRAASLEIEGHGFCSAV